MVDERNILLVEDEEDDIILIRRALRKGGVEAPVDVIRDGNDAMDFFGREGKYKALQPVPFPTIILLDLKLPGRTGFEILEYIKRHEKLALLPVIVFTNSAHDNDIRKAYALGANSYLKKPYTMAATTELLQAVSHYWLECNQRPPAG